jgi:ubiquinone/menaquinone biosynthesis C-methylase UbiE
MSLSESTIQKYDQTAGEYEKKWKRYLDHTHEKFLSKIETKPEDWILDLSGGTGLLAKELVERQLPFRRLVINDPSEGMINIAKNRLPKDERLSFTKFRADRIPFEKNSFDRVFCLNAFHFYHDHQQTLDLLHLTLKPGGYLYLLDWNRSGLFRFMNTIINLLTSAYIDTRSLPELEEMLEKSGFCVKQTDSWNWWYWKFLFVKAHK